MVRPKGSKYNSAVKYISRVSLLFGKAWCLFTCTTDGSYAKNVNDFLFQKIKILWPLLGYGQLLIRERQILT